MSEDGNNWTDCKQVVTPFTGTREEALVMLVDVSVSVCILPHEFTWEEFFQVFMYIKGDWSFGDAEIRAQLAKIAEETSPGVWQCN